VGRAEKLIKKIMPTLTEEQRHEILEKLNAWRDQSLRHVT
jgi:hypothetical protein